MTNEEQQQQSSADAHKQNIQSYESDVPLVGSIRACPDCPYCGNKSFNWRSNGK